MLSPAQAVVRRGQTPRTAVRQAWAARDDEVMFRTNPITRHASAKDTRQSISVLGCATKSSGLACILSTYCKEKNGGSKYSMQPFRFVRHFARFFLASHQITTRGTLVGGTIWYIGPRHNNSASFGAQAKVRRIPPWYPEKCGGAVRLPSILVPCDFPVPTQTIVMPHPTPALPHGIYHRLQQNLYYIWG